MRSHPRHPFDPSKRVVIPVRVRDGKLVPFYGGDMPKLREGWVMDVVTEADAFEDTTEIGRFDLQNEVVIVKAQTELFAVISTRRHDGQKQPPRAPKLQADPPLPSEAILVPFVIKEDLKLRLRGTRPAELVPCRCDVPVPEIEAPESVNQAYTRLSEYYEPWRRSHTGNVFEKVYWRQGERAVQVDKLRKSATADFEGKLFHASGSLPLESRLQDGDA